MKRLLLILFFCAAWPALAAIGSPPAATPYRFPVVLPQPLTSPADLPGAPYTSTVRALVDQLLPGERPTRAELRAASSLISSQDGANTTCHNQANVVAPTGTTPAIMPLCFSDGLGIAVAAGPNQNRTTGFPSRVALGSSFNPDLANAMGQAVGREGRELMVTGLLGPQADTDVFVNWSRGHQTPGEDPYLNGVMIAAEVNGIQGAGLMAQVKHFAGYNGTADNHLAIIQDQAFHEILLPPYEFAIGRGGASSVMCSYQAFRVEGGALPLSASVLAPQGPYGSAEARIWPLDESHFACEQPWLLNYVLRQLWRADAFVGSDYGGNHSASAFLQGDDREDPSQTYFGPNNPPPGSLDPTGDACADGAGAVIACSSSGAVHVAGIPGEGCPSSGCSVPNAVYNGTIPLSAFKQALARVLYQIERFGMLGCTNEVAACSNPGGVGADRSGTAPLPTGRGGAELVPGTRIGDAAISEQVAEQGAVLLKNAGNGAGLPITAATLRGGVAVSGGGAEYLIANPNNEGALGFAERNAIDPLQQLMTFSGRPGAFVYTPASGPTGQAIPCVDLSTGLGQGGPPSRPPARHCGRGAGLRLSTGPSFASLDRGIVDAKLDYTLSGRAGRLSGGRVYRWDGWVYVPARDRTTFRFQHSKAVADDKLRFALDGEDKTISDASTFYHGQYYGIEPVTASTTNAGYVEKGLRNRQCAGVPSLGRRMFPDGPPPGLPGGPPPPGSSQTPAPTEKPVVRCSADLPTGWRRVRIDLDARDVKGDFSFRFAWSRINGDIADAAAAAAGKAMAIVFVNDEDRNSLIPFPAKDTTISSIGPDQLALIRAVAAKNPNTVVVLNTATPIIVQQWIGLANVKAVLNMWNPGQEGGTATARLLLGLANPSGHTTITWPLNATDTIQHYDQRVGLYPGDTPGRHPERANGDPGGNSRMTQGIYSGYRFYDRLGIPVQFPFGYGLSYTRFEFSKLRLTRRTDGSVLVGFSVRNAGARAGAAVAQVYVGPGAPQAGVQQAVRALRGFERIELGSGVSRRISIKLDARSFQYWDSQDQAWRIAPGPRTVWVGDADSPEHLPLRASISVEGRAGGVQGAASSRR